MEHQKQVLSVTELNEFLKMLMESNPLLSHVTVRGEISNFKAHGSGHLYLTLKDSEGQLRAVMFRGNAMRLQFRPEDGMRVLARGRISVYGATGQYQLYIDDLQPDGAGALALRFEELKRRLAADGLFDADRKKPLPAFPTRIGVITSPTGAAVQDIMSILGRRFPSAEVILFPSAVQGVDAPQELCMGVEFFSAARICDVIIIGRGGGSIEDLWAFNDEGLARAIAACPIPVISAVGHETDFTICDFAADRRAPTPSAAAELAVPDRRELLLQLEGTAARMGTLMGGYLAREKRYLKQLSGAAVLQKPERLFDALRMRVSEREARLERGIDRYTENAKKTMTALCGKLEVLNPLAVLARGYAAVGNGEHVIVRAADVASGDRLQIRFSDGIVHATAENEKGNAENAEEK